MGGLLLDLELLKLLSEGLRPLFGFLTLPTLLNETRRGAVFDVLNRAVLAGVDQALGVCSCGRVMPSASAGIGPRTVITWPEPT